MYPCCVVLLCVGASVYLSPPVPHVYGFVLVHVQEARFVGVGVCCVSVLGRTRRTLFLYLCRDCCQTCYARRNYE